MKKTSSYWRFGCKPFRRADKDIRAVLKARYNIDSLNVGETETQGFPHDYNRPGDDYIKSQIVKQLAKLRRQKLSYFLRGNGPPRAPAHKAEAY